MTFLGTLWRVELIALSAILGLSVVFAILGWLNPGILDRDGAALIGFGYTVTFGMPVAALIGAPIYAFLCYRRLLQSHLVVLLGAAPGLPFLLIDRFLGMTMVICGVFIALITHAVARRWSDER